MNLLKHIFTLFLFSGILLISSCKEEPPFIDFTQPVLGLTDTNYITTSVPTAQAKYVLLEDISGVRCVNCPNAAIEAENIQTSKAPNIVLMTIYPSNPQGLCFPYDGFQDLTTPEAEQITNAVGGGAPTSLPSGFINRATFGSKYTSYTGWIGNVNSELAKSTPLNIELLKTYDAGTREMLITAKIIYTSTIDSTILHNFTLAITESEIEGKQTTPSGEKENYIFNHVLRKTLTLALGNPLNSTLKTGRVFEKQFKYTLPAHMNSAHIHIVGFVTEQASKDVVNVRQIDLL